MNPRQTTTAIHEDQSASKSGLWLLVVLHLGFGMVALVPPICLSSMPPAIIP
jgi:hypothetical protein